MKPLTTIKRAIVILLVGVLLSLITEVYRYLYDNSIIKMQMPLIVFTMLYIVIVAIFSAKRMQKCICNEVVMVYGAVYYFCRMRNAIIYEDIVNFAVYGVAALVQCFFLMILGQIAVLILSGISKKVYTRETSIIDVLIGGICGISIFGFSVVKIYPLGIFAKNIALYPIGLSISALLDFALLFGFYMLLFRSRLEKKEICFFSAGASLHIIAFFVYAVALIWNETDASLNGTVSFKALWLFPIIIHTFCICALVAVRTIKCLIKLIGENK